MPTKQMINSWKVEVLLWANNNVLFCLLAVKRLMKEAAELRDPTEHYHAQPLEVSFIGNSIKAFVTSNTWSIVNESQFSWQAFHILNR